MSSNLLFWGHFLEGMRDLGIVPHMPVLLPWASFYPMAPLSIQPDNIAPGMAYESLCPLFSPSVTAHTDFCC